MILRTLVIRPQKCPLTVPEIPGMSAFSSEDTDAGFSLKALLHKGGSGELVFESAIINLYLVHTRCTH